MKKYLLPRSGRFFKAGMHTHTTVSDGKMTPEETKAAYKALGYAIVAFPDHEVIVPHPELRDEDFLPITGYELSISQVWTPFAKCYHLNVYMPDADRKVSDTFCVSHVKEAWMQHVPIELRDQGTERRPYDKEFVARIIDIANREGCLVSYNHPVWSNQSYEDYSGLKGLWGVEWYNYECARAGYYDNMQPIDDLLREGEQVFPLATDDCHSSYGGGWLMVKARSLDYGNVFDALRRGDFYSSSGPAIKSLYIEDGIVTVKTSAVRQIRIVTGQRIRKVKNATDRLLTGASFDIRSIIKAAAEAPEGGHVFWRIEITDKSGRQAMTRAFRVNGNECE